MSGSGQLEQSVIEGTVNFSPVGSAPARPTSPSARTPAQRSNMLDLTARGYALWRAHSLSLLTGGPLPLTREAEYFLSLCRPQTGQQWLDVGTSAGFYAGVLARAGAEVLACDISPAMLREAARREPDSRIQYALLNAEHTGLPAESLDGVSIGATLNETACPQQMFTEAQRLLRPGGQLWVMALGRDGTAKQALLSRLGGLSFPDEAQLDAWLPQMRCVDGWRRSNVLFRHWIKSDGQGSL
ncbi:class I SAM-dependent methyltransferase [Deinococcus detaillensis]|uniref:Class I SAM-dependent methyltransferase n=1 Tax=Deinococcus detaillensis TaxID=2592048 RepID=A0A553V0S2_9DEIO|nr:class I SAM-dependent methyltransferase [Deinococcus detaillensis]TSA86059.1 class I SAM-dependent methyltransferase [Deinococcus detaillensis]